VADPTPGEDPVRSALRLALRAPSVHNCQPWRWLVGPESVHLYADGSRQVPATDPHGRDLLISCGAALDHFLVALASLGRGARVRRIPNPAQPGHLATVELLPHTGTGADEALAAAIPRRRTDRRRFSSWPVPAELIGELLELARVRGVGLEAITDPTVRWKLFHAITAAAEQQAADPAYAAEMAMWSGRGAESDDGVPAANATAPQHTPGQMPLRAYASPSLPQPPSTGEPENAALLLLTTPTDSALDWLRAGEATSAGDFSTVHGAHDSGVRAANEAIAALNSETRRVISSAARRENVSSRMRCGSAPFTSRCATRCASVLVLPEPAPAITSSGGPTVAPAWTPCSTALRCCGLSASR